MLHGYCFLALVSVGCSIQLNLPLQLDPERFVSDNGSCALPAVHEGIRQNLQQQVQSLLRDSVVPSLRSRPQCPCGGPGEWTRIAYLNMSDPSQQCPPNWNLITAPVRGCSRLSLGPSICDSASFSSAGKMYAHVCGQVNAYQRGSTDAFDPSVRGILGSIANPGLGEAYIDGISLTHGMGSSQQHIWSFVAALFEVHTFYHPYYICACTNTSDPPWPYPVPSFVGNNYFCATGNPGPNWDAARVYAENLLWDGKGCGPTNVCCEFNNPQWFCTTLPQPTTDDLELCICHDQDIRDESIIVSFAELYVM